MIDRKDRSTIFNAEHGFLDMIYVGLQRRRLRKKLGDELRSRLHVLTGRVLLARAQTCNKGLLTFGIFLPELVVVRTEATVGPPMLCSIMRMRTMPGTLSFGSAFHQRIPQRVIISGTTLCWILCTTPPCLWDTAIKPKVAPGCRTSTSARDRDESGLAVFVEDLRRLTVAGGSRSAGPSAGRCHADCM